MHTSLSTSKMSAPVGAAAVTAVLAAVMLLGAAPARAMSDADQAEALIREGVRLRGQDQTARALPLFQKAYELSHTPRTAGQLGLCEMELASYVAAERHLGEALASPDYPWIAKNKPALKRQLEAARANIGELVVTVSPSGAEVFLNGRPVDPGLLGGPIRVDKGQVVLEVRAAGFETAHDTLTITAGKREQRTFRLVPAPPQLAAASPAVTGLPPAVAPAAAGPDGNGGRDTAVGAPRAGAGAKRMAAWITGGVAIGALVLGTVEAFNAASKRDAFNDHTGTTGGVTYQDCGAANVSAACKPLKDAYDQAQTLSIVGFAAAGALAVTSAVLFVLSSPDHEGGSEIGGPARAFACVPDVGVRGVGCALRF